ncbi:hypothetical protein HMPREF0294_1048 [Corynebacterium glucuronolyticum ATCC 51867]|nr:hypothetical protein HMPREF0294_1048 [Corynebacterium glucuronolyticum ATCC 51867]
MTKGRRKAPNKGDVRELKATEELLQRKEKSPEKPGIFRAHE